MILRLSVTLVDKINNAKPDALLFADGQGKFKRQFSSLVTMTHYLIGIKSNSLKKMPNTIVSHKSKIGLDNSPWHYRIVSTLKQTKIRGNRVVGE
jgi:hypothetical protein